MITKKLSFSANTKLLSLIAMIYLSINYYYYTRL